MTESESLSVIMFSITLKGTKFIATVWQTIQLQQIYGPSLGISVCKDVLYVAGPGGIENINIVAANDGMLSLAEKDVL